jgi:hypothetical protein
MQTPARHTLLALLAVAAMFVSKPWAGDTPPTPPRAFIDGTGPGWQALGQADFTNVNCLPTTWSWKDGVIRDSRTSNWWCDGGI